RDREEPAPDVAGEVFGPTFVSFQQIKRIRQTPELRLVKGPLLRRELAIQAPLTPRKEYLDRFESAPVFGGHPSQGRVAPARGGRVVRRRVVGGSEEQVAPDRIRRGPCQGQRRRGRLGPPSILDEIAQERAGRVEVARKPGECPPQRVDHVLPGPEDLRRRWIELG